MDRTIEQPEAFPLRVQLGELGYLTQGEDGFILIEKEAALALSDMLVAWVAGKVLTTPTDAPS